MAKKNKDRDRKLVYKSLRVDGMEGTREDIINAMDEAIKGVAPEYHQYIRFGIDSYGYPYDPETYHAMHMTWQELESDEEWQKRLSDLDEMIAARAKREQAEYERLAKIYGNSKDKKA